MGFKIKPLAYVAAPYRLPEPVVNTHNAIKVCEQLRVEQMVTPVCPHATLIWHLVSPQPVQAWLDYDLDLLAHCHSLFRLEGKSEGADNEVIFARGLSIPVFYEKTDLYDWASKWTSTRRVVTR